MTPPPSVVLSTESVQDPTDDDLIDMRKQLCNEHAPATRRLKKYKKVRILESLYFCTNGTFVLTVY